MSGPQAASLRYAIAFGGLVAAVGTAGSLFLSLGLGLVPCELCWYQRILLYPLVVVFGVAFVERRATVFRTTLPPSVPGAVVAAYHSWLQWTAGGRCTLDGGCATVHLCVLGLSVPNLSLVDSLSITGISTALLATERRQ